jgi:hypothetical protein
MESSGFPSNRSGRRRSCLSGCGLWLGFSGVAVVTLIIVKIAFILIANRSALPNPAHELALNPFAFAEVEGTMTVSHQPHSKKEAAYIAQVTKLMERERQAATSVNRHATEFNRDETVMDDPAWIADVTAQFAIIDGVRAEVGALTPPRRFLHFHQLLVNGLDAIDAAGDAVRVYLTDRDPTHLADQAAALDQASTMFEEANTEWVRLMYD